MNGDRGLLCVNIAEWHGVNTTTSVGVGYVCASDVSKAKGMPWSGGGLADDRSSDSADGDHGRNRT